jgi:UDP-N-acetylglucosamine 1-carboxyvinyltransferase
MQNIENYNSIDFVVKGGKKLSGTIKTNYSKNGAMGLLCGALLNFGTTTLRGIPRIEEVNRILEVMRSIGITVTWTDSNTLIIQRPKVLDLDRIDKVAAGKTRTILMFIAPLMFDQTNFKLPNSQGCKLGKRTINPHIYGLETLGTKIEVTETDFVIDSTDLQANLNQERTIIMSEASDTGTEELLLAAAKRPGLTTIKFASANYMVQDVCFFLLKCGVKIEGIGTHIVKVWGVPEINSDIEYCNSEDPIESMTFLAAAICTNSSIIIEACPIDFLELELSKLTKMGFKYNILKSYKAENGQTNLVDIQTLESSLVALEDKISCGAYPDINMDNLPYFVPICCLADGKSLIHDWVYENRSIYFIELNRLNAKIDLLDPHRVYVNGKVDFKPAQVVCPPALRPAMIILIAMLAAPGVSILRNVYSIKRGYEEIASRLNSIGADIEIV